jgi:hypothetical protein
MSDLTLIHINNESFLFVVLCGALDTIVLFCLQFRKDVFLAKFAFIDNSCQNHFLEIAVSFSIWFYFRSRGSAVGIATGYGVDDRGVGVWLPVGSRIFSSPCLPDWLWGLPSFLSNAYRRLILRGKAARAWSWPLTSNLCQGQENVDLYIHSPIRLHGVVHN